MARALGPMSRTEFAPACLLPRCKPDMPQNQDNGCQRANHDRRNRRWKGRINGTEGGGGEDSTCTAEAFSEKPLHWPVPSAAPSWWIYPTDTFTESTCSRTQYWLLDKNGFLISSRSTMKASQFPQRCIKTWIRWFRSRIVDLHQQHFQRSCVHSY